MKPRYKEWGPGFHNTEEGVYKRRPVGGSWTTLGTENYDRSYSFGYLRGYDLPNFHSRKRKGELLPMTPFSKFEASAEVKKLDFNYGTQTYDYYSSKIGWPPESVLGENDLLDLVNKSGLDPNYFVQAAASKIYSSGWDALTFVAEFNKLVSMFKQARKRWLHLLKNPRQLEKLYLEGRYGWRILVYDLRDLYELINNFEHERVRHSERVGSRVTGTTVSNDQTGFTSTQTGEHYEQSTSWTVSVRGSVVADIKPPALGINPAITAWETTPWSFVLDWFISVGQWMESLSFLMLSSEHTSAGGYHVEATRVTTAINSSTVDPWIHSQYDLEVTSTAELSVRTPVNVSMLPIIKVRLDVEKLTDVISLLRQGLR